MLSVLEKNRGIPISGATIATTLGVSRTSVWKAISKLKDAGYPIESAPHRGYLLSKDSDILSKEGILPHLAHPKCGDHLVVFDALDSTNRYLKEAAANGAPDWSVAVANEQTAGRGRMNRSFYSPAGCGVYMSILLRPNQESADTVFLTVAAAVAVRRALYRLTKANIGIKWVNDLFLNQKKICGILCEGGFEMETGRISHVVVGIGINVHPVPDMPKELQSIVGHLSDENLNRNEVAAVVLDELYEITHPLDKSAILTEYKSLSILLGKEVTVVSGEKEETALAADIDSDAHLVVRYPSGEEKALCSGEVRIKL